MKRNTIQRSLTLEAVQQLKSHPTAEEVYYAVAEKHPTISRGTVYRNLNELSESGEIRKMEIPSGADHFDHRCHDHYHVRCLKCGKVFDLDMEYIPDLEKSVKDVGGFKLSGYDLVFKGICPECSASSGQSAHTGAEKPVNNRKRRDENEKYHNT